MVVGNVPGDVADLIAGGSARAATRARRAISGNTAAYRMSWGLRLRDLLHRFWQKGDRRRSIWACPRF